MRSNDSSDIPSMNKSDLKLTNCKSNINCNSFCKVIEKLPKPTDPEENPIDEAKLRTAIIEKRVGSILNTPYDYAVRSTVWQKMITLIEDVALKETDLKIPIIYGIDSIHGANYIQEAILFPQPLSLGASFNVDLSYGSGMYTAMETRAVGIPWNFNPVLDVGRQPLWPRYNTHQVK